MPLYLPPLQLEGYDVRIKNTVQKVNEHRRRRAMLLGFGQDPVAFIHGLAATQVRMSIRPHVIYMILTVTIGVERG